MATNPITLLEGTTAFATDVESKVNPLYSDVDETNVDQTAILCNTIAQSVSGAKTFDAQKLKIKGAGVGIASLQNANTANNRIFTLPDVGADATLATTSVAVNGLKGGTTQNIGFSKSGDALTICQANGSAFADTEGNRGYVWIQSATNGQIIRGKITANVTITLSTAHWGLDTRGNLTGGILRVYAINDGNTTDDFTPKWGIGYQGSIRTIDAADTTTAASVTSNEILLLNSSASAGVPCVDIGYITADRNDTTNTWTIQSLNPGLSADGIWQPWLISSPLGFSGSLTVSIARWMMLGKTIYLVTLISGTSNSTSFQLRAPAVTKNSAECLARVKDNGSFQLDPGVAYFSSGGISTIALDLNLTGSSWTNSGDKSAAFNLVYESNR